MTIELKSTKDILIEEQERIVKLETIKKSLEVEVRNLQVRIEEVEANALAGGKRVIAKLESRIRDVEIEVEEERRRHAETDKMLRKKDHRVKELLLQTEEDHKQIQLLQEAADKLSEKVKVYKRQMQEQVSLLFVSSRNFVRCLTSAFPDSVGGHEPTESDPCATLPARAGGGRGPRRPGRIEPFVHSRQAPLVGDHQPGARRLATSVCDPGGDSKLLNYYGWMDWMMMMMIII